MLLTLLTLRYSRTGELRFTEVKRIWKKMRHSATIPRNTLTLLQRPTPPLHRRPRLALHLYIAAPASLSSSATIRSHSLTQPSNLL